MSKTDELPPGPFFDAIRYFDELVAKRRAKYFEETGMHVPDGSIAVSAYFAKCLEEAREELRKTT
jgi:hypothetical protein